MNLSFMSFAILGKDAEQMEMVMDALGGYPIWQHLIPINNLEIQYLQESSAKEAAWPDGLAPHWACVTEHLRLGSTFFVPNYELET